MAQKWPDIWFGWVGLGGWGGWVGVWGGGGWGGGVGGGVGGWGGAVFWGDAREGENQRAQRY